MTRDCLGNKACMGDERSYLSYSLDDYQYSRYWTGLQVMLMREVFSNANDNHLLLMIPRIRTWRIIKLISFGIKQILVRYKAMFILPRIYRIKYLTNKEA